MLALLLLLQAPQPQLLVPEVSVIVDIRANLSGSRRVEERNRVVVEEMELSLQGYLTPTSRADVFLALHRHEGGRLEPEICEGYVTFSQLGKGLSLRAGHIHIPFGKINPLHGHHRPFADLPPALETFFGHHGLVGDGAILEWLLPMKTFARLELGRWAIPNHHHLGHLHLGLHGDVYTLRLWTGREIGPKSHLDIGLSGARVEGKRTYALGLDIRWRRWPQAFEREEALLEVLWGRAEGAPERRPFGAFLYLGKRLDQYHELGARLDWAKGPDGKVREGFSLLATKYLTETTFLRLQVRYNRLASHRWLDAILNFTWGMGPHAHRLE
ncbi:MAG TPA: hypothetical protein EYP65_08960 [Armatimonadetes bacterium]|nr:hypothetical protein [Armatimonadota bacterium]